MLTSDGSPPLAASAAASLGPSTSSWEMRSAPARIERSKCATFSANTFSLPYTGDQATSAPTIRRSLPGTWKSIASSASVQPAPCGHTTAEPVAAVVPRAACAETDQASLKWYPSFRPPKYFE